MSPAPVLLWFRQDLRLSDHRALAAAIALGRPIIPVYILDDETPGPWRMGGASRWWLHNSLKALAGDLEGLDSRLILARGSSRDLIIELMEETGADSVHVSRSYEPWARALWRRTSPNISKSGGRTLRRFQSALLFEPEVPKTKAGDPFRVFTPFYKTCLSLGPAKGAAGASREPRLPA